MTDGLSNHLGEIGSESIQDAGIGYEDLTSAVQAGSNATGAGSEVWVAYPNTLASAPQSVNCSAIGDSANTISAGSIGAGSFIATSHGGASEDFHWIAVNVA